MYCIGSVPAEQHSTKSCYREPQNGPENGSLYIYLVTSLIQYKFRKESIKDEAGNIVGWQARLE